MFSALPYEVQLGLMLFITGFGVGGGVTGLVKAWRRHRAGEPYTYAWWDGGFRAGKQTSPTNGAVVHAIVLLIGLYLANRLVGGWRPHANFTFVIPPGWVDLSKPPLNYELLPETMRERTRAVAAGTARFAADLEHIDGNGYATFSAGYSTGNGRLDEPTVRALLDKQMHAEGINATIGNVDFHDVDGHRTARVVMTGGDLKAVVYLFEKERSFAIITCGIPASQLARVEPICDANADVNVRRNFN